MKFASGLQLHYETHKTISCADIEWVVTLKNVSKYSLTLILEMISGGRNINLTNVSQRTKTMSLFIEQNIVVVVNKAEGRFQLVLRCT